MKKREDQALLPISDILTPKLMKQIKRQALGPTPIQQRLLDAAVFSIEQPDAQSVIYQHSVFCQTYLPYRNPGDDVREWQRKQGMVSLLVEAGQVQHPKTQQWVKLGLPWGTKPRLILAHLNAEALRQGSPVVEIEGSLSAFVKRIRGFNGGREDRKSVV